jgi:hypothetical protein
MTVSDLLTAIRAGDLDRVKRILLPEEFAFRLGAEQPAFQAIGEYLRGQRLHMDYFE